MKFSNHEPEAPSFQLAPMIDIVFLLLIFFILTWNVAKKDVEANKEIKLPTTEEGASTNSYDNSMVIEVYKGGKIQVGDKVYSKASIKQEMKLIYVVQPDKKITIWADKDATVEQAFNIFNICKGEGFTNVNIAAKSNK